MEDVVVDVAEELDARLDSPVPVERLEDLLLEEEARVETAHMPVRFRAAVLIASRGRGADRRVSVEKGKEKQARQRVG